MSKKSAPHRGGQGAGKGIRGNTLARPNYTTYDAARQSAFLKARAVDHATEADELWFNQHPGATRRVRLAIRGEFSPYLDPEPGSVVEVTQLAPGVRARRVL